MDTVALIAISLIVLVISILALIVNASRKKGLKIWGILAGACVAVIMIASALPSSTTPSPTVSPPTPPQVSIPPIISLKPDTSPPITNMVVSTTTAGPSIQASFSPSRVPGTSTQSSFTASLTPASPTISVKLTPPTTPLSPTLYSLIEALDRNLVTIKVNGNAGLSLNGVSSGDVIEISFLRQKPEMMKIAVPTGISLLSTDPAKQNMVIYKLKGRDPLLSRYTRADEIILNIDDWQVFLFEAYCLDLNKGNILDATTFSVGGLASQEIVAAFNAAGTLDSQKATTRSIQIAIWSLTNDPTLAEIQKRFTADEQSLAGAWAILDKAGLDPHSRKIFAGYTPAPSQTSVTGTHAGFSP
jgi:hypothetical protein